MKPKVLVAYFSASGQTEELAVQIADSLNVPAFKIRPIQPYTPYDLDYTNIRSRSSLEMKTLNARPAFIKGDVDISEYQIILLGFPIWSGVEPKIIDTFLESYDFTNKTIFPFATSGGDDIIMAEHSLKLVCPHADIRQGQIVSKLNAKHWAKSNLN